MYYAKPKLEVNTIHTAKSGESYVSVYVAKEVFSMIRKLSGNVHPYFTSIKTRNFMIRKWLGKYYRIETESRAAAVEAIQWLKLYVERLARSIVAIPATSKSTHWELIAAPAKMPAANFGYLRRKAHIVRNPSYATS